MDALSLKNFQFGFVYILLSNFKSHIYLFFSATLSQKNVKRIQYFDKNKIAKQLF